MPINPVIVRDTFVAVLLCALAMPAICAADLYYQPFDITSPPNTCDIAQFPDGPGSYPFPADWLRYDIDGRTPFSALAYINDAWIVHEDRIGDLSNCAALSTSWYTPAGQADDWMWSPAVTIPISGAALVWRGKAVDPSYPDGYEVRIMTGATPTPANQTTSDIVFSTAGETAQWTYRAFDLSGYAGQAVHVGFRNNSNDQYLLLIDDVHIVHGLPDLAAAAPVPPFTSEYARAPLGMQVVPSLTVTASNLGGMALTNVIARQQPMRDGEATGDDQSAGYIQSLGMGESVSIVFHGPAAYSGAGNWSTKYQLTSMETPVDSIPENDSIEIPGTTIGGNELARWEGAASGTIGIGAGNGGELGVAFTIPADDWYAGAHFGMGAIAPDDGGNPPTANPCPGFDFIINLRGFDTNAGVPGEVIANTEPVACEYDTDYSVDVPFAGGPRFLAAGTYVLTAVEPVGGPALQLVLHNDRFVNGTTWADWPDNPYGQWVHFDAFGTAFAKTPELSLLSGTNIDSIFADGFDGTAPRPAALKHTNRPVSPPSQSLRRWPVPTRLSDVSID